MADIAFASNWMNLFFIHDGNDWLRIGAGINSATQNNNEEVSDEPWYDGEGMSSSDVTGGQLTYDFSGNRKIGDPAQDLITSLQFNYDDSRKCPFRWVSPEGNKAEGVATITDIVSQGGDSNNKSDFSFTARFNGRPTFTNGNASQFPETITAKAVSVSVGETVASDITIAPEKASASVVYATKDDEIAKVDIDGNITGVAVGETEISVKSAVKPSVLAVYKVTVTATS